MLCMEIEEGADAMHKKAYYKSGEVGCSIALRLSQPFFHSNRCLVGDARFASATTATKLKLNGIDFIGLVKGTSSKFPKQELTSENYDRGEWKVMKSEDEDANLISIGWKDLKLFCFVCTRGVTSKGNPVVHVYHHIDSTGPIPKTVINQVEVDQPALSKSTMKDVA